MSLSDEQSRFMLDVCLLTQYASRLGFKVTSGEFERTREQQKIYIDRGLSKTMNSQHLKKLAADLNFIRAGVYINGIGSEAAEKTLRPLGKFWESLDPKNRWGGNFDKDWSLVDPWKDCGHFERSGS